jgi:hypothetical protein
MSGATITREVTINYFSKFVSTGSFSAKNAFMGEKISASNGYSIYPVMYKYRTANERLTLSTPYNSLVFCKDFGKLSQFNTEDRDRILLILDNTNPDHMELIRTIEQIVVFSKKHLGKEITSPIPENRRRESKDIYLYCNIVETKDGKIISTAYTDSGMAKFEDAIGYLVRPGISMSIMDNGVKAILKLSIYQLYISSVMGDNPLAIYEDNE